MFRDRVRDEGLLGPMGMLADLVGLDMTLMSRPGAAAVKGSREKNGAILQNSPKRCDQVCFRSGPRSLAAEVQTQSNLKTRLENWEATQDNTKLTLQRNIYGMHAPMRLLMERRIVTQGTNPFSAAMSPSNLHLDILMGRDETLEPADAFLGMENEPSLDIHEELRKKNM
ncbi:putative proteasome maturation factor ump1 [Termitomyces sp. J132]|nr:putative proteasome maturation factor ump1 [Termitomyces sp. J132]